MVYVSPLNIDRTKSNEYVVCQNNQTLQYTKLPWTDWEFVEITDTGIFAFLLLCNPESTSRSLRFVSRGRVTRCWSSNQVWTKSVCKYPNASQQQSFSVGKVAVISLDVINSIQKKYLVIRVESLHHSLKFHLVHLKSVKENEAWQEGKSLVGKFVHGVQPYSFCHTRLTGEGTWLIT